MKFYYMALEIDDLIKLEEIDDFQFNQLSKLIKVKSLRTYFYRNLENPFWFIPLIKNNNFSVLSEPSSNNQNLFEEQFYICEYLQKVAQTFPKEVTEIIKKANTDSPRILSKFVEIGIILPTNYTSKLVVDVKKWTRSRIFNFDDFSPTIIKWFEHFVKDNKYDAALRLLNILTIPKKQRPNRVRDKEIESVIGKERNKAVPVIEYYWFKGMLTDGIKPLFKVKPFEVISILTASLEQMIKIEYNYRKPVDDLSFIWRVTIEDSEQNYDLYDPKESLLVALRNFLETTVKDNPSNIFLILQNFLKHKYSIFKRIAIHVLRLNHHTFKDEIGKIIHNKELLFNGELAHEYYLLLKEIFDKLDPTDRQFIIKSIISYNYEDKTNDFELNEEQKKYISFDRLRFFEPYLEGEDKGFYKSLKDGFPDEKISDTVISRESSFGERAPLSASELESKDDDKLFLYLKDFNNAKGENSPTVEGLARIFGVIVKENPERFLKTKLDFILDLKPNYAYWFTSQITDIWKTGQYYNVEEILSLFSRLMHYENLPKQFTDEWGTNYNGVRSRILDAIQSAIRVNQKDFPIEYKEKIWEIIEYLCYYGANSQDSQYRKSNDEGLDPFTLSLNSIRGAAMYTLIDYALWYAYNTKDQHTGEHPNRMEDRVINLLETKLDKNKDNSLDVHSTFGFFIANLAYLNFDWLKNNLDKIFPEQKEYWDAALSSYFYSSQFYPEIFELLKPQFERALNYLEQNDLFTPTGPGNRPGESLSEYFIVAAVNGFDDVYQKKSLTRRYFSIKNNPDILHAIQFITNLAQRENIFYSGIAKKSFWPQAKEIWKTRIKIAKKEQKVAKPDVDKETEQEFSKYLNWLNYLPKEITLIEIESQLSETIKLNRKGFHLPYLIDYLNIQSQNYPLETIRLFDILLSTEAPLHFYFGKEKEIENILVKAIESNISRAKFLADKIMNRFGEMGNYRFKELWIRYFSNIKK
jgi:hypothetical protein